MPGTVHDSSTDSRAIEVFKRAIEEVGGAAEVVRRHEEDMLPALLEAAYVLVMREEHQESPEEIAGFLGVTPGAVDSVFQAPMELFIPRLKYAEDELPAFIPHTEPEWSGQPLTGRMEPQFVVGALAKFAYSVVKRQETPPPDVH